MPSVVLPEPDSPTMPSVSPRRSSSVAARTASNAPLRNQPRETSKLTRTPRAVDQHRRIRPRPARPSRAGRLASSARV